MPEIVPDILIIANNDWANVGYVFQESLRAVGVKAMAVKRKRHGFQYPGEAHISTGPMIRALAQQAKGIIFMHSHYYKLKMDLTSKFVAVFHGGNAYRRNPKAANQFWNPRVDATLIQTADLLDLGAVNQFWIQTAVDTSKLEPKYWKGGNLVIGHYPRSPEAKGSKVIRTIMHKIRRTKLTRRAYEYRQDDQSVSWEENLKRMRACDVYLESLCVLDKHGRKVGEWGVTALEAAALGNIVITVFNSKDRYEETFGPCPILAANGREGLKGQVMRVINLERDQIKKLQIRTRSWVEREHSYEALGNRLKEVFSPCL